MVRFRLVDFVILGGLGSFGFVAWDYARNEGKVLSRIKQSVFKGGEQFEDDDKKTSEAESLNVHTERTSGVATQTGTAASKKDGQAVDVTNFDPKFSDEPVSHKDSNEPLGGSDDRDEELSKRMTNIGI